MDLEIVVAIIGAFAIVAAAYITSRKREVETELIATKVELRFKHAALSFQMEAIDWDHLHTELRLLFTNSSIDSFIVFCAWNGFNDPLWTTAIFQFRKGENIALIHVETDADYVQMLKDIKNTGVVILKTEDLPENMLRSHYTYERVKVATIHYFDSRKLEGTSSVAVRYCSYRSTITDDLDVATLAHCKRITDFIKGAIA